jgi:hypothetical protein
MIGIAINGHSLNQPSLRLLLDPSQRVGFLFKSENRIDFTAAVIVGNSIRLASGVELGDALG